MVDVELMKVSVEITHTNEPFAPNSIPGPSVLGILYHKVQKVSIEILHK